MKIHLLLFGLIFTSFFADAQSGEIDSLFITDSEINITEKIEFKTRLSKTRMVGTMSCGCGNKDFYYQIYKEEQKQWKLWLDHTEYPEKDIMCLCKSFYAEFKNDRTYSIPAIKEKGKYQIRINGNDFTMISEEFEITR